MAYQMIHMEIAYRLLKQLSMVENGAEFILGAVAPDSVHMNQNYEVGMKVSSHMFEFCGKWGDTQRNHLLTVQYAQPYVDISDHVFLPVETVEEFISFAVQEIKDTVKLWQNERCC